MLIHLITLVSSHPLYSKFRFRGSRTQLKDYDRSRITRFGHMRLLGGTSTVIVYVLLLRLAGNTKGYGV